MTKTVNPVVDVVKCYPIIILASKRVAWLGFITAVVGAWLTLLGPVSEVFEIISTLGFGFYVWMIVMGVVLWRAPEPVSA